MHSGDDPAATGDPGSAASGRAAARNCDDLADAAGNARRGRQQRAQTANSGPVSVGMQGSTPPRGRNSDIVGRSVFADSTDLPWDRPQTASMLGLPCFGQVPSRASQSAGTFFGELLSQAPSPEALSELAESVQKWRSESHRAATRGGSGAGLGVKTWSYKVPKRMLSPLASPAASPSSSPSLRARKLTPMEACAEQYARGLDKVALPRNAHARGALSTPTSARRTSAVHAFPGAVSHRLSPMTMPKRPLPAAGRRASRAAPASGSRATTPPLLPWDIETRVSLRKYSYRNIETGFDMRASH